MPKPVMLLLVAALCCAVPLVEPPVRGQDGPGLGKPADSARLAAWDLDVSPDGAGLPPGRGSVQQGAALFAQKCAACHGDAGAGKPADRLTGGVGSLKSARPIKTVASYWPYATTLFAYIRSAMPITDPQSLTADEVYALSAYLLSIDGIVGRRAVLDADTLARVRMPNRNGFRSMWSTAPPGKPGSGNGVSAR